MGRAQPAAEVMNAREDILAALRIARPSGEHPLPELPSFPGIESDLVAAFQASLSVMGGQWAKLPEGETLSVFIRARVGDGPLIRSATDELPDLPRVDAVNHPRDLENVDVAVVRARFGVAETGSVFLSDRELRVNTIAYLAQHLIVLLDPEAIVPGIADAYLRPRFRSGALCVVDDGTFGDGGHRGRHDSRRAGRAEPDGRVRKQSA